MDKSHEVADHLDRAADYMEEHGWCQNIGKDANGAVCLIGAVDNANYEVSDIDMWNMLAVLDSYVGMNVEEYNDTVLTNKADAVKTLRDAAVKARPDS